VARASATGGQHRNGFTTEDVHPFWLWGTRCHPRSLRTHVKARREAVKGGGLPEARTLNGGTTQRNHNQGRHLQHNQLQGIMEYDIPHSDPIRRLIAPQIK
jgi:hypothetical protein